MVHFQRDSLRTLSAAAQKCADQSRDWKVAEPYAFSRKHCCVDKVRWPEECSAKRQTGILSVADARRMALFTWLREMFRRVPDKERVAQFCAGRSPESDDVFLSDLGPTIDPETQRIALAVRKAVGRVGSVGAEWIRASDAYPDQLSLLPIWESMDWVIFVMELEEALDTQFTDRELERVRVVPRVTVAELVAGIRQVLAARKVDYIAIAPPVS
jgi:acyl carrier protein